MKKIVITQRLLETKDYFEVREALDIKWGKLFKELGFLPIVLPIECDFEEYFDNIDIEGIFLTGGNDLGCLNNNYLSEKRDTFEKRLLEYGIKNEIPIFGVCRGMQIIGEYFGASFVKIQNHVSVKHSLILNKNSKYMNELSKINKVNSFHNYAIDDIDDNFFVSAKSSDGIIKAIEHKRYKIFAQMWHTEREEPFIKDEVNLIKVFFNS